MHTSKQSLIVVFVALAFAGTAFASQASKPATASPAQSKATVHSSPAVKAKPAMASHAAVGTIEKYDANTLTLKTTSGEEQFTLASAAKVRNGSKKIKANDLSSLTGQRAKVRYTESNGQRTAESVMVSSAAHKAAAKGKAIK